MSVTIKDVAKEAGVSFSTVSKALRNSPLVTEKTKRKILNVAKEMGYQPNNLARSLVSKKMWTIGVVWPSVERVTLSALITQINTKLEEYSYTTLLSINKVDSAIEAFNRIHVDAILVFDDLEGTFIRTAPISNIPLLYYGISDHQIYPTVDANRGKAISLAVDHLVHLGHEHITYIGDVSTKDPLQEQKVEAFIKTMNSLGKTVEDHMLIRTSDMDLYSGYSSAKEVLQNESRRPTAVICGSYDITRGLLRAVNELHLKIPSDISIISYDHIPQMAELDVPITAVGVPLETIADHITKQLLLLSEKKEISNVVSLDPELIIRTSTANNR
ncbi:LacI family DNA-binding transcriptional regulator [Chengkuizengella axinellae]|uniref:LacI family DNA-binding transcriptional regulator n=1 Tax=Chengkuizengella axinellae TaxID=3064388 RepID=A0ABT9IU32_9BACL|nr:LacI family DNA-binding transcriptional regulator [Chengkuizengella sp. 2205SS18-9]MDP5272612.1 LacI family DNA-binding transcriptional regulator [Chengkuizengella sp. 2205SS18-9]